jgi:hypothetical protein
VALCQARTSTKPLWGLSSSNPYHPSHVPNSRETSNSGNNCDIRTIAGIPATAETTGIYDLEQRYQQQQKQRRYTNYRRDTTVIYDLKQGYQLQ